MFEDSGFAPIKMRKVLLFGGWAKPMAVESSSVPDPATGMRRGIRGTRRYLECFDQTVAGVLSDAVYYSDELARWLDGDVSGLIRDGRSERRMATS